MKFKKRVIIYPKDVQLLTGRSYRQSLRLMNKAKAILGKTKDELLGFKEFCECYKISLKEFKDEL
ncbi:hypothetical protein IM532_05030 [Faecalibacter sp. WQ 117]|uniref:Uncharacterized protein n=1 Tax=Faecalibacter rhinopitheci TaxID=2779678 RepID=A0A8J7FUZ2_9FLAO|nr:hypothetical protein [Faecalibacter rhinopitheci]